MLVADPAQVADDLTRTGVYLGLGWALALAALVGARLARRPWATRLLGAAGVLYLGSVARSWCCAMNSRCCVGRLGSRD